LKQRIVKLVVDISSKALDKTPSFALKVLEYTLMTRLPDQPEFPAYSEAVKELHGLASHELRRLATRYADYFSVRSPYSITGGSTNKRLQTFYDLLEPKIQEITLANRVDDKLHMEFTSILLIIMYGGPVVLSTVQLLTTLGNVQITSTPTCVSRDWLHSWNRLRKPGRMTSSAICAQPLKGFAGCSGCKM
jgi:hypothetical protein